MQIIADLIKIQGNLPIILNVPSESGIHFT